MLLLTESKTKPRNKRQTTYKRQRRKSTGREDSLRGPSVRVDRGSHDPRGAADEEPRSEPNQERRQRVPADQIRDIATKIARLALTVRNFRD